MVLLVMEMFLAVLGILVLEFLGLVVMVLRVALEVLGLVLLVLGMVLVVPWVVPVVMGMDGSGAPGVGLWWS